MLIGCKLDDLAKPLEGVRAAIEAINTSCIDMAKAVAPIVKKVEDDFAEFGKSFGDAFMEHQAREAAREAYADAIEAKRCTHYIEPFPSPVAIDTHVYVLPIRTFIDKPVRFTHFQVYCATRSFCGVSRYEYRAGSPTTIDRIRFSGEEPCPKCVKALGKFLSNPVYPGNDPLDLTKTCGLDFLRRFHVRLLQLVSADVPGMSLSDFWPILHPCNEDKNTLLTVCGRIGLDDNFRVQEKIAAPYNCDEGIDDLASTYRDKFLLWAGL